MTFVKNLKFTLEQLKTVEEIASKHALIEVAEYLGIGKDKFNNLRVKNESIKEAVQRGLDKKGNKKTKSKDCAKEIHVAQSSVNSQQREALRKFREEFEKNKLNRLKRELRSLDII